MGPSLQNIKYYFTHLNILSGSNLNINILIRHAELKHPLHHEPVGLVAVVPG